MPVSPKLRIVRPVAPYWSEALHGLHQDPELGLDIFRETAQFLLNSLLDGDFERHSD